MISLSFNISWPWFKNNYELCKDYFYKGWKVTKYKTLELQISRGGDTLIGASFYWHMRCDHAGLMLDLNLFRHFFIINFYDNRHWNYDKNRYINYDDPEEVEEYC